MNDDGSAGTSACCDSLAFACNSFYTFKETGTCGTGGSKTKYTCICNKGDLCDDDFEIDLGGLEDWDLDDTADAVAKAFITTIILATVLPFVICVCICVCCCYCNKTCCFEQKQEPIIIQAAPQQ